MFVLFNTSGSITVNLLLVGLDDEIQSRGEFGYRSMVLRLTFTGIHGLTTKFTRG